MRPGANFMEVKNCWMVNVYKVMNGFVCLTLALTLRLAIVYLDIYINGVSRSGNPSTQSKISACSLLTKIYLYLCKRLNNSRVDLHLCGQVGQS